ncbi:transformer-2 protein homolog beta isoform X2 [Trichoplusia ni]|uniref:Transformer-2 protein homolog beta isoform X2 n=1 Tax=Trichoplusia ni TaxID=7111 RepID=A0A7E5V9J5_TRINI|nr:transformer-2 protein homolog beta isoform X2 [Trichoplusia ni]
MSDRERSRSRTRNGSREPAPKPAAMSRGHSRSRSRTPPPPKASSRKYRSPSASRSRSRSGSARRGYRSRYSRSRSRSYSPRGSYRRSHSHSPMSSRRRHMGDRVRSDVYTSQGTQPESLASHASLPRSERSPRKHGASRQTRHSAHELTENPTPSRCLGVFGLSLYTTEQQINHIFSKYGPVDKVQVVIDAKTGRSRGFCFVYFENQEDAKVAKNECTGMEIDGRRIRVDYSITQRAHTPTPGIYMGKPTVSRGGDNGYDRRRGDRDDYYYRGGGGGYRERDYYHRGYRHRSPSPHYRRRRYERERSYSPRIETRSKG